MALLRLERSPLGELRLLPLDQCPFPIGRGESASGRLSDPTVSDLHAVIERGPEGYRIVDHSRNGTTVNNARVASRLLKDGDIIGIGPFRMIFEAHSVSPIQVRTGDDREMAPRLRGAPRGLDLNVTLDRNYRVLFEASQKLSAISDLSTLLDSILGLVLDFLPTDYMVAMLYDRERGEFVPRAQRAAPGIRLPEPFPVSQTVLERCVRDRMSVFVQDVGLDDAVAQSGRIQAVHAKSIAAVPLVKHERVLGVVYAAGLARTGQFSHDDHTLLTAVGNLAGVAVDRALLAERAARETAIRAEIQKHFSPQVAEELVARALRGQYEREIQESVVTVLFADLKGFTRFAEDLSPLLLSEFLGKYFATMSDVLFRHDGVVDKFMGDGILAVFGNPTVKPDDADRALRAALEMVETWKAVRGGAGSSALQLRIGVNTGRAFVGTIRTPLRDEYTVLGDVVNVAARLESIADPDSVRVGASTVEAVGDRFRFDPLGDSQVHGREKPVRSWRLLAAR